MKFLSWVSAPIFIVIAGSLVAGCGAPGSRQQMGSGIGAVAGGVTGGLLARRNPVAGAVIGAVAGGIIGGAIGKSLDDEERCQLALASELAAEQPVVPHAPPKEGAVEADQSGDQYGHRFGLGRAQIQPLSAAGRHDLSRSDPERRQKRTQPKPGCDALPDASCPGRRLELGDPAITGAGLTLRS